MSRLDDELVSHILVSDFDIDKGSTLSKQYPIDVPLPAHMLPKQEPKPQLSEEDVQQLLEQMQSAESRYSDELADLMLPDGCQNQEWDNTIFILNRMPPPVDKKVLEEWSLVDESGDQDSSVLVELPEVLVNEPEPSPDNVLYVFNVIHCKRSAQVRRGAQIKALALVSHHSIIATPSMLRSLLPLCKHVLSALFSEEAKGLGAEDMLQDLYVSLNSAFHLRSVLQVQRSLPFLSYWFADNPPAKMASFSFREKDFPLVFDLTSSSAYLGTGSITTFLRKYGFQETLQIYNAMLMQKKVLFIGHNVPAGRLAMHVLASVMMLGPAIRDVINRTFPVVNLNQLEFENVPGYIAGTTNPFLEDKCQWDVLVNVVKNTVRIADSKGKAEMKEASGRRKFKALGITVLEEASKILQENPDEDFMRRLETGMAHLKLGERWLRQQFAIYTQQLVDMGLGNLNIPHAELDVQADRVLHMRYTKWFLQLLQEEKKETSGMDWSSHVRQLFYALRGFYKSATRKEIIRSVLNTFASHTETKEARIELAGELLRYFGGLELTEALTIVEADPIADEARFFLATCLHDLNQAVARMLAAK